MSRIWRRFCDAPEVKTAFAIDKSTPKQLSVLKQSSDLQQVPGGCLWATLLSGVSPDFHNILTKKKKKTNTSGRDWQEAIYHAIVLSLLQDGSLPRATVATGLSCVCTSLARP